MPQCFFIWNNKDSRSMGIVKRSASPIIRPEERVKHVEIPGVSGDVTETEGEDIYQPYIQTATITVIGGFRVRDVYKWLRGSGYVTFDSEPDRRQQARIIGAITLEKISRNMDRYAGEVQFYCQPLKEKLQNETVTITGTADVINSGDVLSRPLILATASATSMVITAGTKSLSISGLTSGNQYVIDSQTMEVLNSAGTETLTKNTMGDWPELPPGATNITGSGWSSLVIDRRERFL